MYNPSLKFILVGLGIGLLLIAIPFFLLKAALVFLIVGSLFRFVGRRIYWSRRLRAGYEGRGYGPRFAGHRGYDSFGAEWHPAVADTIRTMSEEEYGTFRQKLADERSASEPDHRTTIEIQ